METLPVSWQPGPRKYLAKYFLSQLKNILCINVFLDCGWHYQVGRLTQRKLWSHSQSIKWNQKLVLSQDERHGRVVVVRMINGGRYQLILLSSGWRRGQYLTFLWARSSSDSFVSSFQQLRHFTTHSFLIWSITVSSHHNINYENQIIASKFFNNEIDFFNFHRNLN